MPQLTRSNAAKVAAQNKLYNSAFAGGDYAEETRNTALESFNCSSAPRGFLNKPASQSTTKKEFTMNELSHALLLDALNKNSEPLHPNFARAFDRKIEAAKNESERTKAKNRKAAVLMQRTLCARAIDANPKRPLAAVIAAVKANGAQSKAQAADLIRQLMKDATFDAHIQFRQAERAEHAVPSELSDRINASLDALAYDTDAPFDTEDGSHEPSPPTYDDARLDSQVFDAPVGLEPIGPYDGPSTDEICEAIEQVNAWLQQVVRALFTREQDREYFRIDPLPFSTTWDAEQGKEYAHDSFEDACAALDESFKRRTRILATTNETELAALAAM